MKIILQKNKIFNILLVLYILPGIIWNLIMGKEKIHIIMNHFFHPSLDFFFKYFTHVGDGVTLIILTLIIILFFSIRIGLIALTGLIFSGIVTYILKQFIFFDFYRPLFFFQYIAETEYTLRLVEGVKQVCCNSFPSGHTTAAFAFFTAFAFSNQNKIFQIICFMLAFGIAYSRIYLSQHFLVDTIAGAFIGTTITTIFYFLWLKEKKICIDKSLLKVILKYKNS